MSAAPELMTLAEVGDLLRVDPKTVSRWCHDGKLDAVRTPGGRWRPRRAAVLAVYEQAEPAGEPDTGPPPLSAAAAYDHNIRRRHP
jgi:excisionase family DNA binding protein